MSLTRTFLLVVACLAPLAASAQWQWIDKSGRRVFSDQPPPPDIPDRNIVKAPASNLPTLSISPVETGDRPAPAASAPARGASAPGAAASQARAEAAQEARRKAAEAAAEQQKRKAEEERIGRLRADNCGRARSAKATIDSGQRLVRTNEKGEREILDDSARLAESRRLDEIIASDCKP